MKRNLITICRYTWLVLLIGACALSASAAKKRSTKPVPRQTAAATVDTDSVERLSTLPLTQTFVDKQIDSLIVFARKSEMPNIMRIAKAIDPDAFMSISNVMGVYGKGFDTIKS